MWKIPVGGDEVSALYDPSPAEQAVFVCGHGAGGNMSDRSILAVASALQSSGIGVVRFNFPFSEKRKSKRRDPVPVLMETIAAVADRVRDELTPKRLLIGGRSMGGRIASMMAGEGFEADGLLLLAYPLHPPGQPHNLRDAHLPSIQMPVLCFNGTRDPFCQPDLMKTVLERLKGDWTMCWLEGADHGFHVLKSSGRSDADVLAEVGQAARTWVAQLSFSGPARAANLSRSKVT